MEEDDAVSTAGGLMVPVFRNVTGLGNDSCEEEDDKTVMEKKKKTMWSSSKFHTNFTGEIGKVKHFKMDLLFPF